MNRHFQAGYLVRAGDVPLVALATVEDTTWLLLLLLLLFMAAGREDSKLCDARLPPAPSEFLGIDQTLSIARERFKLL
jgi:hypothetical protein